MLQMQFIDVAQQRPIGVAHRTRQVTDAGAADARQLRAPAHRQYAFGLPFLSAPRGRFAERTV
jgi:hypothetical protein